MKRRRRRREEGEGGVLPSETHTPCDTWPTAGDGRGESEYWTDRDPETHALRKKKRGSQPSVVGPLLFCSCAGVSELFSASSGTSQTTG